MTPKVTSLAEAIEFVKQQREEGKTIVTTNGTFDLFHPGHEFLLSEAKKQGDILIVGINSDVSVKRYKGEDRPVEAQDTRAAKVATHADAVFIFSDDDPREWLKQIRPDVHVNAETYGDECIEKQVLDDIGAKLVLVPIQEDLGSTSKIIASQQEG